MEFHGEEFIERLLTRKERCGEGQGEAIGKERWRGARQGNRQGEVTIGRGWGREVGEREVDGSKSQAMGQRDREQATHVDQKAQHAVGELAEIPLAKIPLAAAHPTDERKCAVGCRGGGRVGETHDVAVSSELEGRKQRRAATISPLGVQQHHG